MDNEKNIHEGHRERMLEKVFVKPELFSDHELLEILLFFSIPRKDVNPLAHKLLRVFGGVKEVFDATKEELLSIDGVGKKTVAHILTVGEIYKRISNKETKPIRLSSPEQVYRSVKEVMKNAEKEKCSVFFINKNYSLITVVSYSDTKGLSVSADPNELARLFAIHKPKYVIIAHNHISGTTEPSKNDVVSTRKLNLLCELHGVDMIDHVIVCKEKIFSFRDSGMLDMIKNDTDINKILSNLSGGNINE